MFFIFHPSLGSFSTIMPCFTISLTNMNHFQHPLLGRRPIKLTARERFLGREASRRTTREPSLPIFTRVRLRRGRVGCYISVEQIRTEMLFLYPPTKKGPSPLKFIYSFNLGLIIVYILLHSGTEELGDNYNFGYSVCIIFIVSYATIGFNFIPKLEGLALYYIVFFFFCFFFGGWDIVLSTHISLYKGDQYQVCINLVKEK